MDPERIRVLKTLRPGAPGAKRLQDQFGPSLVCVRYRYDPVADARLTTVELILETTRRRRHGSADPRNRPPPPEPVAEIRVSYRETAVRARIKQAGGRWRPDSGLWELPLSAARRLGITNRIVRQRGTAGDEVTSDHTDP
jgi:hypothetical protein